MLLKDVTLLFVEDNKDTQQQIKMIFEDNVKAFYQAFDGEEGFQLFYQKNPDIIITDINMLKMTGLELLSEIQKIDKHKPVIMMSAYNDKEKILEAVNNGANGYITKPIDLEALYDRLSHIAAGIHEKRSQQDACKQTLEKFYKLAHYDTLTNIPNRMMFDIELIKSIETAKSHQGKLALFFIDLDYFKEINDNYGHEAGDFVLKHIVSNISKIIPEGALLARRSGDEFLLLLKDYTDVTSLKQLAQSILDVTLKEISWKEEILTVSCSMGISLFDEGITDHETLINLADNAMYNAKRSGKATYAFFDA